MWCPRAAFGNDPPAAAGDSSAACPELEAVVRHALTVWAVARDRGGLTARGLRDVAEALDAVGQVVDLFAAAGRVAGNAGELSAARSAARRTAAAIRRHAADAPSNTPGPPSLEPPLLGSMPPGPTFLGPTIAGPPPADRTPLGPACAGPAPTHLAAPSMPATTSMTPPSASPPDDPRSAAATSSAASVGPETATSPPSAAARVLVVDDDHAHRDTLVRLLRLCGHQASAAADGQAALDAMRSAPPQVVLLDMMMPGLTGADVLRAMGADPALRRVPVVVYSAAHEPTARAAALNLGARDYLVKSRAGLDEIQAAIARYARAA